MFSVATRTAKPQATVTFRDALAASSFRAVYFEPAVAMYRRYGLLSSRRYLLSNTRALVSRTAGFSII